MEWGGRRGAQVGGLLALENPPDVDATLTVRSLVVGAIAHQTARRRVPAPFIDRRDCMPSRQREVVKVVKVSSLISMSCG